MLGAKSMVPLIVMVSPTDVHPSSSTTTLLISETPKSFAVQPETPSPSFTPSLNSSEAGVTQSSTTA